MFSWKRALLHGLIPFGLVIVTCLVVLFAVEVHDPEKFGEGTGQLAFAAFAAGFCISCAVQSRRRKAAP